MPEGPSLVILREQAAGFAGQTIVRAEGNTSVDKPRLEGQRIVAVRTWGKHFLLQMPDFALRIHFLLFGSYRINERKEHSPPRLSLRCDGGDELNFYTCSVKFIEEPLDAVYDWQADVMSDAWNPALALQRLRAARAPRPAMRCWTRTCLRAWATSSRTRCCTASACTLCQPWAPCLLPSCVNW